MVVGVAAIAIAKAIATALSIIASVATFVVNVCKIRNNKVYDKNGDVAKESVQEIIVRDVNDIKSKLDCLTVKDLYASRSFLEEGVQLLSLAIETPSYDESESPPDEASGISNDRVSGVVNAASSFRRGTQELITFSKKRFLSATDCFKASREEATRAFNNKALSIKDRIMACGLRVAARILESGIEDPEIANAGCLVAVKELHGLPEIQDMFLFFLKGGRKSCSNIAERLENLISVLSINHALFDFASKNSQYPNVFTWPKIKLKDGEFNPVLDVREIVEKTGSSEEFSRKLSRIVVDGKIWGHLVAVNSRSELVVLLDDCIKFIKSAGVCKDVMFPEIVMSLRSTGLAIAVDSVDNVYVVRSVQERDGNEIQCYFLLHSFDKNYKLGLKTTMDFLDAKKSTFVKIAVDKNGNIIVIQGGDNRVYICNNEGQLKFEFERDRSLSYSLSITNNNDIMIPSDNQRSVHVYTTEGKLKSTIKIPVGHEIGKVAFHHGICKIIIVTYCNSRQLGLQSFILCCSETGELEHSEVFNGQDLLWRVDVVGHCSGPFVVHWWDSVSFI